VWLSLTPSLWQLSEARSKRQETAFGEKELINIEGKKK
jgi:hypothetical protein